MKMKSSEFFHHKRHVVWNKVNFVLVMFLGAILSYKAWKLRLPDLSPVQARRALVKTGASQGTACLSGDSVTKTRGLKPWINFCMLQGLSGAYLLFIKTSYGVFRILNFDWLKRNGIWAHIPKTTNMLGLRVFFAMFVDDFKVFF